MEDGADANGDGGGTKRGSEFGPGETLSSSDAGGSSGGSVPRVVYFLIALVFLLVWGFLSLF